jgi:hypothetical protein
MVISRAPIFVTHGEPSSRGGNRLYEMFANESNSMVAESF